MMTDPGAGYGRDPYARYVTFRALPPGISAPPF